MSSSEDSRPRLRTGIVLGTDEVACTLVGQGRQVAVPYAAPFPRPRGERVAPGHLVATAAGSDGAEFVVWRWYDAVVLGESAGQVRLWEPGHGEVRARPRDPGRIGLPGSRAYLSAGLPGAEWWLAGPAVVRGEDADVELDEVDRFFSTHGLWDRLV